MAWWGNKTFPAFRPLPEIWVTSVRGCFGMLDTIRQKERRALDSNLLLIHKQQSTVFGCYHAPSYTKPVNHTQPACPSFPRSLPSSRPKFRKLPTYGYRFAPHTSLPVGNVNTILVHARDLPLRALRGCGARNRRHAQSDRFRSCGGDDKRLGHLPVRLILTTPIRQAEMKKTCHHYDCNATLSHSMPPSFVLLTLNIAA